MGSQTRIPSQGQLWQWLQTPALPPTGLTALFTVTPRLGAAGVDADVAGTVPPAARRRHLPSRPSARRRPRRSGPGFQRLFLPVPGEPRWVYVFI